MVCAPNAYKGALSAAAATAAMARGVAAAAATAVRVPVADGGDGTLDVLLDAAGAQARYQTLPVTGPLGEPVVARLGWTDGVTAVVELAEAAGLRLLPERRQALLATSRGAGELISAALSGGARRVLVGVGGSASTDGGGGLATALGVRLLDAAGRDLPDGGGALVDLDRIEAGGADRRLRDCRFDVAVDVRSPLLGLAGAAAVFAPQKGGSPAQVQLLETGLARLAGVAERDLGVDPSLRDAPGAGAAGGAAWGLAAFCGATLHPGAELVCDAVGLDAALVGAALVLTGEGHLDSSTAAGKAPAAVAARTRRAGLPCVALVGAAADPPPPLFDEVVCFGEGLAEAESMRRTAELLERATTSVIQRWTR